MTALIFAFTLCFVMACAVITHHVFDEWGRPTHTLCADRYRLRGPGPNHPSWSIQERHLVCSEGGCFELWDNTSEHASEHDARAACASFAYLSPLNR